MINSSGTNPRWRQVFRVEYVVTAEKIIVFAKSIFPDSLAAERQVTVPVFQTESRFLFDGNSVQPGLRYSLCFRNGKEWQLIGSKQAEEVYADFDRVPRHALLNIK